MAGVFRNNDPPPPHRPTSACVPPAFGAEGGHTRWVERGCGSIVRKTPDTVLYSIYVSTLCLPLMICRGFLGTWESVHEDSEHQLHGFYLQQMIWLTVFITFISWLKLDFWGEGGKVLLPVCNYSNCPNISRYCTNVRVEIRFILCTENFESGSLKKTHVPERDWVTR